MSAKSTIRSQFEKKIIPIIRTEPKSLSTYLEKKCAPINNCETCKYPNLINETGLTEENVSIYARFIRMWGKGKFEYCVGADSYGYSLCYGRELVPLITRIHREIFSQISNLAYTLKKCETKQFLNFEDMHTKSKNEIIKYWNNFDNGIFSLNNAYQKTEFKNSKDILKIPTSEGDIVYLHGHQLKSFLQGKRFEQKSKTKIIQKSIAILQIGHYHKLGVFSINGFDGLVISNGFLGPHSVYFPEMLSQVGNCISTINKGKISYVIRRKMIDIDEINKTIEESTKKHNTFEKKIEFFKNLCKIYSIILPGNHDAFDEIYLKDTFNIENFDSKNPINIGLGDYIDFTSSEKDDGEKRILEILDEENFKPISTF